LDVIAYRIAVAQVAQQRALTQRDLLITQAAGQVRHHDVNAAALEPYLEPARLIVLLAEMRLFHVEYAPLFGTTSQQMLWPLKDEIPTQVRKTQEIKHGFAGKARSVPVAVTTFTCQQPLLLPGGVASRNADCGSGLSCCSVVDVTASRARVTVAS
jgi:hypothetical protein